MKKYLTGTLVALALLTAPLAMAAEQGKAETEGQAKVARAERRAERAATRKKAAAAKLDKLIQSLDLPAETETQVRQILETHAQASANWRRENQEDFRQLRKQLQEAKKAGDKQATAAAQEKMKHLNQARKELSQQLTKGLSEKLNVDQMAKVKKSLARGAGKPATRPPVERLMAELRKLGLTRRQGVKVRRIIAEAQLKAMRAALAEIKTAVLTREQLEKLDSEEVLKSLSQKPQRGKRARPARQPRAARKGADRERTDLDNNGN